VKLEGMTRTQFGEALWDAATDVGKVKEKGVVQSGGS